MRIGELARAVGVTTRAVRHYHQSGLLPEPVRLGNGYRDYGLRHAVVLARIRRLTELDEDLARQEAAIRERRTRLRALLETEGGLTAEGPVSPELAALFRDTAHLSGSPTAARDREMLALIETATPPEERERLMGLLGGVVDVPGGVERVRELYERLDALADAEPDDPRVEETARAMAASVPDGMVPEGVDVEGGADGFLRAFYADFPPAQAEVIRRMVRIISEEGS